MIRRCALAAAVACAVAVSASAQVTGAKPALFSLDTGATHYPQHLGMVLEGTGTNLNDEIGSWDLTLSGGATWGTDGTHGAKVILDGSNGIAAFTGIANGLSGTITACFIVDVPADPGSVTIMVSLGDSAAATNVASRVQTSGILTATSVLATVNDTVNTTFDVVAVAGWNLVCLRAKDDEVAISMNGAAWQVNGTTHTGIIASLDEITIGAEGDNSTSNWTAMEFIAWWFYTSAKDDAAIAAIYNAGSPWSAIGVVANTQSLKHNRRRWE
jgi:hypothetical protein